MKNLKNLMMKNITKNIDLLLSKVAQLEEHDLTKKESTKIADTLGNLADKLEAKLAELEKTKKAA
ncbi:MAG: hypothetical protein AB8G86_23640 [Saprospiraceae bacterium]